MSEPKTIDDIYKFLDEHWPKINKAADVQPYLDKLKNEAVDISSKDLKKSSETILSELHAEARDDQSRDRAMTVSKTLAKFGSLLTLLSIQADIQSRAVIRLTRWLIVQTWIVVLLTIILLLLELCKSYH